MVSPLVSQGEKQLLLGANIGEGIFFAGNHHVPIYIVASPEEHKLITTRPQELLARQKDIPPAETVVEETKSKDSLGKESIPAWRIAQENEIPAEEGVKDDTPPVLGPQTDKTPEVDVFKKDDK